MIEVPVYNQNGQQVETIQVDEQKLGGDVNQPLLKQALVAYHANLRQGTRRTKRRGEVAGSTRKMFKQKGTGNARTGGIRNPIKKGGGHAKQRLPKEWRLELPTKVRRAARNSAILTKLQSKDLRVVSDIKLDGVKTKPVVAMFKALGIDRSVCVAMLKEDDTIVRSVRNIARTTLTTVRQLNAWDIMNKRTLLVTKAGLELILA
jgi:large subunit ribosomal protein L4